MPLTAIALGSNQGDREANLKAAIKQIGVLGDVTRVSKLRETAPVGYLDQPDFLNGMVILDTELRPADLMQALLNIEQIMGRDRTHGPDKGPRLIDLDLILYGEQKIASPRLAVPHPEMLNRQFVLEPLAEVAPDWIEPTTGKPVSQLYNALLAAQSAG